MFYKKRPLIPFHTFLPNLPNSLLCSENTLKNHVTLFYFVGRRDKDNLILFIYERVGHKMDGNLCHMIYGGSLKRYFNTFQLSSMVTLTKCPYRDAVLLNLYCVVFIISRWERHF